MRRRFRSLDLARNSNRLPASEAEGVQSLDFDFGAAFVLTFRPTKRWVAASQVALPYRDVENCMNWSSA